MVWDDKKPIVQTITHDEAGTYIDVATEATVLSLASEAKLELVRIILASIDGKDFATEATLAGLAAEDFATETTLSGINVKVATEATLAGLAAEDFATETTLAALAANDFVTEATASGIAQTLTSLDGKDYSTETTLASLEAKDFSTETTLSGLAVSATSLDGKDFATETTQATLATEAKLEAVRALLATIDADTSNLDVALSTLATETKLEAVRVLLASLDSKDYATQTTLASILVDTGQLEALLTTIDADTSFLAAYDFATQTTLAAILVDSGQIEALLTTIDADTSTLAAVDFATQTTLAAADAKLSTIDAVLDSIKDTDGIKKITDPLPTGTNIIGIVGLDLPKLYNQLPDPNSLDLGDRGVPHVDNRNRLITKSQVSSDEGAFRDDFTSPLHTNLTGTLTFTTGVTVSGSGTAFSTELTKDSHIRLSSDSDGKLVRIKQIYSDTSLELRSPYTGSTTPGAALKSDWLHHTGAGMTISQAGTSTTISTGTTLSGVSHFQRDFHGPGTLSTLASISQRIANQDLLLGFHSPSGGVNVSAAQFVFSGTLNNKIILRTASPGGTTLDTTYTLPVGDTTAEQHNYKVEVEHERVRFFYDRILAAEHPYHNSLPYENLVAGAHVNNTGTPASSTDLVIDEMFISERTVIEVKVSGALDNLRTDEFGNLQVVFTASAQALPLLINLNFEESSGAIVANQYKRVMEYLVPPGFDGYLIRFSSFQNESSKSRLVAFKNLGTYDYIGDVWTPDETYVAPKFVADVEAEVTLETASGGITKTITVTYTNEAGTTGRTGTFSVPKSSIVGTRIRLVLQSGDLGVQSIQSMSDDSTTAGQFNIVGNSHLAYHNDLSNTIQLETNYQPGAIAFPSGTKLAVEYAGGTVSKDRLFDLLIQLVPEAV